MHVFMLTSLHKTLPEKNSNLPDDKDKIYLINLTRLSQDMYVLYAEIRNYIPLNTSVACSREFKLKITSGHLRFAERSYNFVQTAHILVIYTV